MAILTPNEEEFKKQWETLRIFLTFKEHQMVAMRLGLLDGKQYKLREIGDKFRITRERVRQIILVAIHRAKQRNTDLHYPL